VSFLLCGLKSQMGLNDSLFARHHFSDRHLLLYSREGYCLPNASLRDQTYLAFVNRSEKGPFYYKSFIKGRS